MLLIDLFCGYSKNRVARLDIAYYNASGSKYGIVAYLFMWQYVYPGMTCHVISHFNASSHKTV